MCRWVSSSAEGSIPPRWRPWRRVIFPQGDCAPSASASPIRPSTSFRMRAKPPPSSGAPTRARSWTCRGRGSCSPGCSRGSTSRWGMGRSCRHGCSAASPAAMSRWPLAGMAATNSSPDTIPSRRWVRPRSTTSLFPRRFTPRSACSHRDCPSLTPTSAWISKSSGRSGGSPTPPATAFLSGWALWSPRKSMPISGITPRPKSSTARRSGRGRPPGNMPIRSTGRSSSSRASTCRIRSSPRWTGPACFTDSRPAPHSSIWKWSTSPVGYPIR